MSDEKPELAVVMEHYGVRVNVTRDRQMVRCPFGELHAREDRTPSCSVSLRKQVFKCHSCSKGGDAYALIMEKEGCDFRRARAFASTHGFEAGSAGGGDGELSGSAYGGRARRKVPDRSRDKPRGGGFRPSWRGE